MEMATHAQPSSGNTTCDDTQGVAKMLGDLKVKRKRLLQYDGYQCGDLIG